MAYFEPLGHPSYFIFRNFSSIVTASLSIYAIVRLGASTVSVFGNLGTVLTIVAGAVFYMNQFMLIT